MMPKFSIIVPVHDTRVTDGRLKRCLDSVATQVFEDFECIVVDDASKSPAAELVAQYDDKRFRCVAFEKARGRVIARNVGMKQSQGEFLLWLDSDDALDPMYLETFAYHVEKEPEARIWVCGAVVHGMVREDGRHVCPVWTQLRHAWMPPVGEDGRHTLFTSGKIGTGMFVFHRECLDVIGLLPPWKNCYNIADGIDEWLGVEPGATGYGSGGPGSKHAKMVGNPFGDDHALLQKLALHWKIHLIDGCLYVHYVR